MTAYPHLLPSGSASLWQRQCLDGSFPQQTLIKHIHTMTGELWNSSINYTSQLAVQDIHHHGNCSHPIELADATGNGDCCCFRQEMVIAGVFQAVLWSLKETQGKALKKKTTMVCVNHFWYRLCCHRWPLRCQTNPMETFPSTLTEGSAHSTRQPSWMCFPAPGSGVKLLWFFCFSACSFPVSPKFLFSSALMLLLPKVLPFYIHDISIQ